MKDYFETEIKPLNNKLRKDLGIKKVPVYAYQSEVEVPVRYKNDEGVTVVIKKSQINAYRNTLGLKV